MGQNCTTKPMATIAITQMRRKRRTQQLPRELGQIFSSADSSNGKNKATFTDWILQWSLQSSKTQLYPSRNSASSRRSFHEWSERDELLKSPTMEAWSSR